MFFIRKADKISQRFLSDNLTGVGLGNKETWNETMKSEDGTLSFYYFSLEFNNFKKVLSPTADCISEGHVAELNNNQQTSQLPF